MSEFLAKVRVVLTALPTWLAAATAVLTVVLFQVVPLLPDNIAVRAAAILTAALAVLRAAGEAVARLTPVKPDARGVLPK